MAQVKTVKTRIQHKHDIEANWIKATNFVPLAGELIIYDAETTSTSLEGTGRTTPITYTRFKFGDGTNTVTNLAFSASPVDWNQNDPQASDYIKNRTHYVDDNDNVTQLDTKYIPIDNNTITIQSGKLKANIPADVNTTYTLSKDGNVISLIGSDGYVGTVIDESGSDGLIYKETTTTETINITTPVSTGEIPHLAYGNGRLVLLSHDAGTPEAYYSDDGGQTWQRGVAPTSAICQSLVYGNGKFVGVAFSQAVYSEDGINWSVSNIGGDGSYRSIAFTDGVFMAHASQYVAISEDGVTWNIKQSMDYEAYYYLAGGNGKFVFTEGTGSAIVVDLEGNVTANPYIADPISGITFVNGKFVAYGGYYVNFSEEGENWTSKQVIDVDGSVSDVYYINNTFFAVVDGSRVFQYNEEQDAWSEVATIVSSTGDPWQASRIITLESYVLGNCSYLDESHPLLGSSDGINWGRSFSVTSTTKFLEQAGTDVTAKVASLVGGNSGGMIGDEIETLTVTENLTVSGNFTLEGDFVIGDLDASTVTIATAPTADNHAVNKKYLEEVLLNGEW